MGRHCCHRISNRDRIRLMTVSTMINREGRTKLAHSLRQLVDGEITTDQFELFELGRSGDIAINEIWYYATTLYHGLYPYRLRSKHALFQDDREQLERCIMFLNSELEYRWPPFPRMIVWYWLFLIGVLLGSASIILSQLGLHMLAAVLCVVASFLGNPCRKRSHLLVENGPARVMTSAGSRRGRSCLTSLD